ncbi:hypothetical protein, partial [Hyphomonas beringensis]|uniref:hypothetical protein n=1 Tax=Hyphomonas beringensis TaxID=1280946 RepID=UPI000552A18D
GDGGDGGDGGQGAVDGPERKQVQEPELPLDLAAKSPAPEPAPELKEDGPVDPVGDKHLDAVRRAAGLDRQDADFLPDF